MGATLAVPGLTAYTRIAVAALAGGAIGALLAGWVPMTAMPEMVALLHSFVGAAATLVGLSAHYQAIHADTVSSVEIFLGVIIGAITLTGSLIAFGKLKGTIGGKPLLLPARHALNLIGLASLVALSVWYVRMPSAMPLWLRRWSRAWSGRTSFSPSAAPTCP